MIEKIKGKFSENTWNATIVGIVIFCLFAFRRADTYINNYIGKLSFFNSSQNVSLVYLNKLLIALISYLPFTFLLFDTWLNVIIYCRKTQINTIINRNI